MKVIVPLIVGVCAVVLGYFVNDWVDLTNGPSSQLVRLHQAEQTVSNTIALLSEDIEHRLSAFVESVAQDRLFALRLLAEQDKSSPDVTGFAARFIKPMGFSVLDIVDSAFTIVSSGAFPANAGTDITSKMSGLNGVPVLIRENVMGRPVLTFQTKKTFRIVDIPFYAIGGCTIGDEFLRRLTPFEGCTVLLRMGNEIIGGDQVRSVSEIKDKVMIMNDKEYFAASVPIQHDGSFEKAEILIIIEK